MLAQKLVGDLVPLLEKEWEFDSVGKLVGKLAVELGSPWAK